ncbi:glycosyltransferase [Alphaproteobacteria bacterium]|nr:glycosyltransferase [Alphaproteobacteria bacterium]
MKVSCVLATCGRPKLLAQQLRSILLQSRLPNEIIISEDLPNKESKNLLNELEFGDIEVHYLENFTKLGMVQNFNRALSASTGDLIFLCDDDDIWLENKIEFMVNAMLANQDIVICYHNVEFFDSKLGLWGLSKFKNYNRLGIPIKEFIMGSASCFRSFILKDILPIPDFEVGHDNWVAFVAKCHGAFQHHDIVLQHYRRHNLNMSVIAENRPSVFILSTLFRYIKILGPSYRHKMLAQNETNKKRLACIKKRAPNLKNINVIERTIIEEGQRLHTQCLPHLKRFPIIISNIFKGFYKDKPLRSIIRDFITL